LPRSSSTASSGLVPSPVLGLPSLLSCARLSCAWLTSAGGRVQVSCHK